jgi:hypothetical protein
LPLFIETELIAGSESGGISADIGAKSRFPILCRGLKLSFGSFRLVVDEQIVDYLIQLKIPYQITKPRKRMQRKTTE